MKIKKVFNNNVVLALQNNQEVVLIGKGLGFQKKVGQPIDEKLADKVYRPFDERWSRLFNELLNDIAPEYVEIASQIIKVAEQSLKTKFNSYMLIALSDHIHFVAQRIEENIVIKNELLWEIQRFYPEEYEVGKKALAIINRYLQIMLPDDEAGFIALKFVEKRLDNQNQQAMQMTKLISDILTMVQYQLQIKLDENGISYQRFIIHLRYFVERILQGDNVDKHDDFDEVMNEHIFKKYTQAYRCTQKIMHFIEKTLKQPVSNNEQMYLTIHIQRIITELT
ncbi:beta-glucoside operon transcriptional antiterminator [Weissella beninensis]|uniref:PRD domain-containing protein n=1 Tax=Periweissella beninensis TaxID=504936 RepID=A0ABT0VJT8_9LACO|nr:PRD domain-containing protein [Periweissella beninensis]MBM7544597.1 beta-glucoside operon transcriptional antiterminator [Periweissella beninensis]MCM2438096.1 PRD domain-containing protein [Periweissella beninensis]